jgi:hypothetical protein
MMTCKKENIYKIEAGHHITDSTASFALVFISIEARYDYSRTLIHSADEGRSNHSGRNKG